MGLDMFIFKIKRFENATYSDVCAVESWLDLQEYKKNHPGYGCTMIKWCGMKKPSAKLINFYKDNPAVEVAYWRKANAIHKWFVDKVQDGEDDCGIHREVTREDLLELLGLCNAVHVYPQFADRLLPVQEGFFFGSYDYGEWYMENIDETIKKLNVVLEEYDPIGEALYYVSSW